MFENSFMNRVSHKTLWLLVLPLCIAWSLVAHLLAHGKHPGTQLRSAPELPSQWQGEPLRPLALSEVEQRFARRFPGTLARMTDGEQVIVLRSVDRPTRMLHPAADCYRGVGYSIAAQQLERDGEDHLWRCFEAARNGQRLRVCERIVDAGGRGFTDASAWYWAAVLGQSHGPWQAMTVARPL
jgi:hypothetical protein